MPTDFEQRLREGLAARASQVTPDPRTWNRVQEEIRRGQRFRWVLAGTAVAAVAAFAVLVLPGVLTPAGVGFEEGPMADQPEDGPPTDDGGAAPEPPVEPPPVDVVLLAEEIGIIGPEVSQSLGAGEDHEQVAVAPGSTPDEVDVVVAGRCTLGHLRANVQGSSVAALTEGAACAQGPRFSPDGEHLAWVERQDGGTWGLRIIGWDDGPERARETAWDLDVGGLDAHGVEELGSLRVVEWSWSDAAGEGVLHLAAADTAGVNRVFTLPVRLQGDGSLALDGDALEYEPEGDRRMLGYQRTDAAVWSLELLSIGVVEVVRSDEGERLGTLRLPADVLDAEAADAGPVWFEVVDEVVVLGDGRGRSWWTQWDGERFSALTEVAPGLHVRHGAALTAAAAPPSSRSEDDGQEDLPPEVARTRDALRAAAASGDLENLRPLLPDDDFTHSFGDVGDPIAYWRQREAEGEDVLGLIERLLDLPAVTVGEDTGMWAWPFAYDRPYESLSSAEHMALEEAIGPEAMDFYAQSNEYLYYRLGIDAEGTWRFFVAGD